MIIGAIGWQTAISLVIVFLAVAYLVVRLFGIGLNKSKSCGSCRSCADDTAEVKVRELVQIGDKREDH